MLSEGCRKRHMPAEGVTLSGALTVKTANG